MGKVPGIRRKLKCLNGALGMNPSLLVIIAFKVYQARETRALKQTTFFFFFETIQGSQKESKTQEENGRTQREPISGPSTKRKTNGERTAWNSKRKEKERIETLSKKCYEGMRNLETQGHLQTISNLLLLTYRSSRYNGQGRVSPLTS